MRHEVPLRTIHSLHSRAVRKGALAAILDRLDADYSLFYTLSEVAGRLHAMDWQFERDGGVGDAVVRDVARLPYPGVPFLRVRRPPPRATRAFLQLSDVLDPESLQGTEVYRKVMRPLGIADQVRLLVYHGPRFVGSVVAVRRSGSPPFTRKDTARLSPLVEPLARSFTAADAIDQAAVPEEGAHFFLRPDGEIEFAANGPTRGWLESPEFVDVLRQAVRSLDRQESENGPLPVPLLRAQARLIRFDGPTGVRYLVHVVPAPAPHQAVDAALSPAQRIVAEFAASGATVAEIAASLAKSPNTVQTQLRQVYQRLDVSSRLELARALEHG